MRQLRPRAPLSTPLPHAPRGLEGGWTLCDGKALGKAGPGIAVIVKGGLTQDRPGLACVRAGVARVGEGTPKPQQPHVEAGVPQGQRGEPSAWDAASGPGYPARPATCSRVLGVGADLRMRNGAPSGKGTRYTRRCTRSPDGPAHTLTCVLCVPATQVPTGCSRQGRMRVLGGSRPRQGAPPLPLPVQLEAGVTVSVPMSLSSASLVPSISSVSLTLSACWFLCISVGVAPSSPHPRGLPCGRFRVNPLTRPMTDPLLDLDPRGPRSPAQATSLEPGAARRQEWTPDGRLLGLCMGAERLCRTQLGRPLGVLRVVWGGAPVRRDLRLIAAPPASPMPGLPGGHSCAPLEHAEGPARLPWR